MRVNLGLFDNSWYRPGPVWKRAAWMAVNRAFFQTTMPWPSQVKSRLLRAFGAKVGRGVVLKNRVNIKYPWNLAIGDRTWIGEGVWIDSLARVEIGSDACLSQECMIETGNHDWSSPRFDLKLGAVTVGDGAWAAVRSVLLPGAKLASHAVLAGGSTLAGQTEEYGIYAGTPAKKVRERKIREGAE